MGVALTTSMTVIQLASVTKTFTTAILALRAAAGLVNVHLPVTLLLPSEYELSPRMQRVSLQQLATFSGGFPWSVPAPLLECSDSGLTVVRRLLATDGERPAAPDPNPIHR